MSPCNSHRHSTIVNTRIKSACEKLGCPTITRKMGRKFASAVMGLADCYDYKINTQLTHTADSTFESNYAPIAVSCILTLSQFVKDGSDFPDARLECARSKLLCSEYKGLVSSVFPWLDDIGSDIDFGSQNSTGNGFLDALREIRLLLIVNLARAATSPFAKHFSGFTSVEPFCDALFQQYAETIKAYSPYVSVDEEIQRVFLPYTTMVMKNIVDVEKRILDRLPMPPAPGGIVGPVAIAGAAGAAATAATALTTHDWESKLIKFPTSRESGYHAARRKLLPIFRDISAKLAPPAMGKLSVVVKSFCLGYGPHKKTYRQSTNCGIGGVVRNRNGIMAVKYQWYASSLMIMFTKETNSTSDLRKSTANWYHAVPGLALKNI